jgi:phosphate transport system substrate-binding protein
LLLLEDIKMMAEDDYGYSKTTVLGFIIIGIVIGGGIGFGLSIIFNPNSQQGFAASIDVKGSDTLLELASAWAENYTDQNPAIIMTISGGGTGTGIASLISGTIDIATASRPAKASEIANAQALGIDLVEHIMVIDGIAIITNPSTAIFNITYELLKGIYNGSITNWNQVNSSYSGVIVPYSRQSTSGTYAYFQEEVMENDDYAPSVLQLAGNADLINAIISDINGIAYVGAAYVEAAGSSVNVVRVNDPSNPSNYYLPTNENVKNFYYPIARYLYYYTNGKPKGYVQAYVSWCQSPEGQQIAELEGYVAAY